MSRMVDELQRNPSHVFDRLVDGELADAQRRELLTALDDEPAGWRRCALAFLEAQSWGTDFAALRAEPAAASTTANGHAAAGGRAFWARRLGLSLALAASVAASFMLGLWMKPDSTGLGERGHFVQGGILPGGGADNTLAQSTGRAALPPGWRTVKVGLLGGGGEREQVEVPLRQAEEVDWDWVANQPSSITPAMMRELEQAGMRVTRERQVWPIQLENGQQVILPVDQFDLHYVGGTR